MSPVLKCSEDGVMAGKIHPSFLNLAHPIAMLIN